MAKKLNSMPDYQARMPKQPHDTGQVYTFTAAPGMELPAYYDMLHLGDEIHFNSGLFVRLQNPITASLVDIDLHLDYFFVPLSVMFTPAPSMFYQTDDLISSAFENHNHFDHFPLFDIDTVVHDIQTSGLSTEQEKVVGDVEVDFDTESFDCRGKAVLRLLDMFDYSYQNLFSEQKQTFNPKTTPWFLCAYQAVHELYFRNDDREPKSYSYNMDRYYTLDSFAVSDLLRLNYVSAYKDYFNAVKVSPIGSSMSMLSGSDSWDLLSKVNNYLYRRSDYHRVGDFGDSESSDEFSTTVGDLSAESPETAFNAANIRQLFMVDKLLRVTGRANKDYESQFLAHFGVKIPHDVLHNITHLGHDMCTLSPEAVISNSDTLDPDNPNFGSPLGEVGGQGSILVQSFKVPGSNDNQRHFKAPCHGVFLTIFHAIPKMRYYAGVSKLHQLSSPMDFWQPEYDRKGMQPLFQYEVDRDTTIGSQRLGWQFAYEQFKRKFDKVSLAFRNPSAANRVNLYSPWVLNKKPFARVGSSDYIDGGDNEFTRYLATPHDLDTIMTVKYKSSWISGLIADNAHLAFHTDPLIVDYRMRMKKVNFMSEYGEPELD